MRRFASAVVKASPCAWSATKDTSTRARVSDHFNEQAGWNRSLGSAFTADLLIRMDGDLHAGGPVAQLCDDWPGNPRRDALGLRILGALHHGVLTGRAPDLAPHYPPEPGSQGIDETWALARDWLAANLDHVAAFIKRPPQTNETRRAIALLPGFLQLAARFAMPLNLLEIGASAGLNQNWDQFNYQTETWSRTGASDVTISTDWTLPPPDHLGAEVTIAARAACDIDPLDIRDPDEAARLRAYVWPDQTERLARLDAALALAQASGTRVEQANAADWLETRLTDLPEGQVSVVYHSVFLQYPPRDERQRIMDAIRSAGARATPDAPLAWLCYEPEQLFGGAFDAMDMIARLQVWPGGEAGLLLRSNGHVTKVF